MGSCNISLCSGQIQRFFLVLFCIRRQPLSYKHTVIKILKISADLIIFTWLYCIFLISKQLDEVKLTSLATTSTSPTCKQNLSIIGFFLISVRETEVAKYKNKRNLADCEK